MSRWDARKPSHWWIAYELHINSQKSFGDNITNETYVLSQEHVGTWIRAFFIGPRVTSAWRPIKTRMCPWWDPLSTFWFNSLVILHSCWDYPVAIAYNQWNGQGVGTQKWKYAIRQYARSVHLIRRMGAIENVVYTKDLFRTLCLS